MICEAEYVNCMFFGALKPNTKLRIHYKKDISICINQNVTKRCRYSGIKLQLIIWRISRSKTKATPWINSFRTRQYIEIRFLNKYFQYFIQSEEIVLCLLNYN